MQLVSYLVNGEPRYGAAVDGGVVDLTQAARTEMSGPAEPDRQGRLWKLRARWSPA